MPHYEFENKIPVVNAEAFVHPDAVLIGDVNVDAGCYVGAGAVLRGDIGSIRIGKGTNVQENCVLHTFPGTSVILHPNSHIGHGAILHGCEISSYVLIGMGRHCRRWRQNQLGVHGGRWKFCAFQNGNSIAQRGHGFSRPGGEGLDPGAIKADKSGPFHLPGLDPPLFEVF